MAAGGLCQDHAPMMICCWSGCTNVVRHKKTGLCDRHGNKNVPKCIQDKCHLPALTLTEDPSKDNKCPTHTDHNAEDGHVDASGDEDNGGQDGIDEGDAPLDKNTNGQGGTGTGGDDCEGETGDDNRTTSNNELDNGVDEEREVVNTHILGNGNEGNEGEDADVHDHVEFGGQDANDLLFDSDDERDNNIDVDRVAKLKRQLDSTKEQLEGKLTEAEAAKLVTDEKNRRLTTSNDKLTRKMRCYRVLRMRHWVLSMHKTGRW